MAGLTGGGGCVDAPAFGPGGQYGLGGGVASATRLRQHQTAHGSADRREPAADGSKPVGLLRSGFRRCTAEPGALHCSFVTWGRLVLWGDEARLLVVFDSVEQPFPAGLGQDQAAGDRPAVACRWLAHHEAPGECANSSAARSRTGGPAAVTGRPRAAARSPSGRRFGARTWAGHSWSGAPRLQRGRGLRDMGLVSRRGGSGCGRPGGLSEGDTGVRLHRDGPVGTPAAAGGCADERRRGAVLGSVPLCAAAAAHNGCVRGQPSGMSVSARASRTGLYMRVLMVPTVGPALAAAAAASSTAVARTASSATAWSTMPAARASWPP